MKMPKMVQRKRRKTHNENGEKRIMMPFWTKNEAEQKLRFSYFKVLKFHIRREVFLKEIRLRPHNRLLL